MLTIEANSYHPKAHTIEIITKITLTYPHLYPSLGCGYNQGLCGYNFLMCGYNNVMCGYNIAICGYNFLMCGYSENAVAMIFKLPQRQGAIYRVPKVQYMQCIRYNSLVRRYVEPTQPASAVEYNARRKQPQKLIRSAQGRSWMGSTICLDKYVLFITWSQGIRTLSVQIIKLNCHLQSLYPPRSITLDASSHRS